MKTGHDLKGLIKFLGRDDWQHHLEAVVAEHFGPALDEFNLEYNEIGEVLDDQWATTLWGCAFEDFLTRAMGPMGAISSTSISSGAVGRRGLRQRLI